MADGVAYGPSIPNVVAASSSRQTSRQGPHGLLASKIVICERCLYSSEPCRS